MSQSGSSPAGLSPVWLWRRVKGRLAYSIKLRMVVVFLLLAAAMTLVFITGAQKAFSIGWREAARPLLMDYVDRLTQDITGQPPGPPDVVRAQALTQRLPITVQISGPVVNWRSHPDQKAPAWPREETHGFGDGSSWGEGSGLSTLLRRTTTDGHAIVFGIDEQVLERRPRWVGFALTALLLLTLLAWWYVRRLLRPLDAIGEGARRFGAGDFSQPIPQSGLHGPDELGQLATTINTMGDDIRQMLDAKRALLLAISHELRSPLTRARLNTELLPDTPDTAPQRDALLRDLQEMAGLIADLLESERLAGRHAALQREPVDVQALVADVVADLSARHVGAATVRVFSDTDLPRLTLDPSRLRLLVRNLLDNALRHGANAPQPPELRLQWAPSSNGGCLTLTVRDHGPGVEPDQLARLAEPFYRPDAARTRSQGGVGLGLHLCKLVAQAHGGQLAFASASPGLAVTVTLPA